MVFLITKVFRKPELVFLSAGYCSAGGHYFKLILSEMKDNSLHVQSYPLTQCRATFYTIKDT